MTEHHVVAHNYVEAAENRIHSDEIARKYGFRGALVAGVAIWGHLSYPLAQRFGTAWLGHSVSQVKFLKPAYDGDRLTISLQDEGDWHGECRNATGELLADLRSAMPAELPPAMDQACFDAPVKPPGRPEITWDTLTIRQPFSPWHWQITQDANAAYAQQVADDLPIYREAAHPHWLLAVANRALTREYVMPAWIHVGSEIRLRKLLKVNDTVEVRAVPLEKWTRKGHEFVKLYLAYLRDGDLTTEIFHTAIFKVAA